MESKKDDLFKINYKAERYQTIFNNINTIFNNNYLNYISQIKLTYPYLLELFIFLRKYQYFIHFIKIDKQNLCLFDSIENPVLDHILNLKQMLTSNENNICCIKIELLPKFKKSEINFSIPNDVLIFLINFNIELTNNNETTNIIISKGNISITNLDETLGKPVVAKINQTLTNIFNLFIEEEKIKDFKILNKYFNYIENFFPTIFPNDYLKKENVQQDNKNEEEYWTQGEQTKFEELLIKYKNIKDLKTKLKRVSEEFQTKNLKQISLRYKELAFKANKKKPKTNNENENLNNIKDSNNKIQEEKDEKKEEENKDKKINEEDKKEEEEKEKEEEKEEEGKEEEKEEEEKGKEEEEKKQEKNDKKVENNENKKSFDLNEKDLDINKEIIPKELNDEQQNMPSLELNDKQISSISFSSKTSENYSDYSKSKNNDINSYKLETTEDIIDAIIAVYNKNYKDHDISLLQEKSNELSKRNSLSYINYDEEEFEEEDEEKEEGESSEEDEINEKLKKKNNEVVDLCLSSTLQQNVNQENLTLIKNILNFGDKYQVNLGGVQINNISIVQISNIKLLLKCNKCKKVAFESQYIKFNKQKNIFYLGTTCPRCQNEIFSIFISDFIHQNNLTNAGVCYITGGSVIDFLPSLFNLDCAKCNQSKTLKLRTGCLHSNDSNCRKCNTKLNFYVLTANISQIYISDLKYLADCKIVNFEKFNFAIKDDINLDNYVKKYDKVIQEGKELPDCGACKHYKHSLRWFRFSCCNKVYPCDLCHDEISDHTCEYAKTIICGFCSNEQSANNKVCSKCGKMFTKSEGGKKFWEGGKGCTKKEFMSSRDSHKYTGINKTISRRKRKEIENKNNKKK